jgi:ATP-binding cassette subfamily B protein
MRVFTDLKKYKKGLVIVFLLTAGNAIGELFLPYLLSIIVDEGVATGSIETVLQIGFLMVIVTLLTVAVRSAASYFSAKNAMGFSHDLRNRIFNKVNSLTFDETEQFGISSLITRTTNDVDVVEQFLLMAQRPLLRAPLGFFGGLFMAFNAHARLTLIVLTSLPLIFVIIYVIIRKVFPYFPKLQATLDDINLLFRQRLTGLKVIRAFNRNDLEEETFSETNDEYYGYALHINNVLRTSRPLLASIVGIAIVLSVFVGAGFIQDGSLEIGTLMAFVQYTTQMLNGMTMFANLLTIFPQSSASISRVEEVINYPSRAVGGEETLSQPLQIVEAKDLSFTYPEANAPALDRINFKVETGEMLGIIGGTGAGKSTLLKLLLQFYDPTSGELLVNGHSIEEMNPEDVRSEISYVPQQNFFFTETVRGNMRYSNPNVTDEKIVDDLTRTQSRKFLDDETPLTDKVTRGGQNFSGGQRQRLALTRALARDAAVYVFDDSFSALDYRTDYEIRQNLMDVLEKAITIVVAQRVATIRQADKILLLDEGKVAGYGSHEDLMKTNGLYQEIASSQAEEEEEDIG